MIVTVTMNPAIDKTAELEKFEYGGLNRLERVIFDAGGKGINVSKTIAALGGQTVATGFLGGSAGESIKLALKQQGITLDFVDVDGETRTNLKVVENNGYVTELNEPGPMISERQMNRLKQKLLGYASQDTLFVFAGSVPKGVEKTIYRDLITQVKEKGATVFLDADGEIFVHALEAVPDIIKPNRAELEELFHLDFRAGEEELINMGKNLLERGIKLVAVSLGQMGAIFFSKEKIARIPGLSVNAHSTVGAGDAMVAALSYGVDCNLSFEECITLGVATSAGAVTTVGTKPPSKDLVEQLKKQVEMIDLTT